MNNEENPIENLSSIIVLLKNEAEPDSVQNPPSEIPRVANNPIIVTGIMVFLAPKTSSNNTKIPSEPIAISVVIFLFYILDLSSCHCEARSNLKFNKTFLYLTLYFRLTSKSMLFLLFL